MNVFRTLPSICLALALVPASASAANHEVAIVGNSFSPEELSIAVGDTVTFRNGSGGLHNAHPLGGAEAVQGCDP